MVHPLGGQDGNHPAHTPSPPLPPVPAHTLQPRTCSPEPPWGREILLAPTRGTQPGTDLGVTAAPTIFIIRVPRRTCSSVEAGRCFLSSSPRWSPQKEPHTLWRPPSLDIWRGDTHGPSAPRRAARSGYCAGQPVSMPVLCQARGLHQGTSPSQQRKEVRPCIRPAEKGA